MEVNKYLRHFRMAQKILVIINSDLVKEKHVNKSIESWRFALIVLNTIIKTTCIYSAVSNKLCVCTYK